MVCYIYEFYQRSGSRHCGLLYRSLSKEWFSSLCFVIYTSFIKGVVLVIVVCYIGVLSKEWFSSLWFVIYTSFVKGVVLVIVVCYIEVLSKEWFSSLWFVI